jgi:hypothetical protein
MKVQGRMSVFGGPRDTGVGRSENVALYDQVDLKFAPPDLFLAQQPQGTSGTARRLNPDAYYLAFRWDYREIPKDKLRTTVVKLTNPKNGASVDAWPADWGPNPRTHRIADLSPGVVKDLGLDTDDEVVVEF